MKTNFNILSRAGLFALVIAALAIFAQNSRAAGSYAAAVQADEPIAYWRFNDTPPTAVNSGSLGPAANGTYNGSATAGAQAPRPPAFVGFDSGNTALQCDGVAAFVGTLPGLMNSRPVFTISGWMRRNADQPDRTGLWGQNDLVEFGYINNNTLEVWTDNGLDLSPNPIPNGEWGHLAIVSDGSPGTMTMYTNGVVAGSRAHTLPANNTFPFNIGGGGVFDAIAANGNYFNGQIDEVAIFAKALTAAQIAAQYRGAFFPVGFNFDDCLLPPGTSFPGVGNVGRIADDGTGGNCVVHLTDANQGGAFGVFSIPIPPYALDNIHVHWRSLVGGDNGSVCTATQFGRPGADGYSMSWGTDLPNPPSYGNPGEEGAGTGLVVTVDTFDNGGGEAPGLEIKWRGARVAFDNIDADPGLAKDFLRKNAFVEADLTVTPAGQVEFAYDGRLLTAILPDWTGIHGGSIMFAARTGGACDNHWIDDLLIETISADPPTLVQQPANQSVPCGGTATFTVVVVGPGPLTYQWQFNDVDLPDATQPTLSISPVQPSDAGAYRVRVSNNVGSVTSAAATLVVPGGPEARLSIALVNANIVIRWPVTCAEYDLQETPSLNFPINWLPAMVSVGLQRAEYVATAPVQRLGNRFFRLALRPSGALPLQPPEIPVLEYSEFDPTPIGATDIRSVPWQEIPSALTDALATQIRQAAQQDAQVRGQLGDRFAYLSISTQEMPKGTPNFPGQPLQTLVTFFSHSFNRTVLADMSGTNVVGVTNSTRLQPPEGTDEVAAAVALARRDPRMANVPPEVVGRGLLVVVETPGQPGFGNRVIYLTFALPNEAAPRVVALVDLTLQEVISVSFL